MMLLTTLGVSSLLVVAAFTVHATRSGVNPRAAIIEAWINVVIGFAINWCANWWIMPLMGVAHITGLGNFWGGWIYTAISMLRQYAIRRYMDQRIKTLASFFS